MPPGTASSTSPAPSYTCGPSAIPLEGATIGEALVRASRTWPDAVAVIDCAQGVRLTWSMLRERSDALACSLLRLGLKPGDRIGLWSPSNVEWVITQFAAARAGLVLATINPGYQAQELAYVLKHVGCRALVCATTCRNAAFIDILTGIAPEFAHARPGRLRAAVAPQLSIVIQIGGPAHAAAIPFNSLLASSGVTAAALNAVALDVGFDDAANIQFTSGSTGAPRAATLSHHNILNNGRFVGEALDLGMDDRVCVAVPFYHSFGMVMGNLACVSRGATIVIPAAIFEPAATLAAIEQERCTAVYGVPTMFIAMLEHPDYDRYETGSLRTGIMGGVPCPTMVMRQVIERMGLKEITIAYGMTETSPVSFQTRRDDSVERRISTVGRVHPHAEAKIVDGDGRVLPRGSAGELCVRGYLVMRGYWDEDARTRETIDASGWLHTGDLAVMDDEGYCSIVGRLKDMIIRGGEYVSPREVEELLHTHPAIEDVHVFGLPDAHYGEAVCAWVRTRVGHRLTAEEIMNFCNGRIARFKAPRYVRFVESFPMTTVGKVQKNVMRAHMRDQPGDGR